MTIIKNNTPDVRSGSTEDLNLKPTSLITKIKTFCRYIFSRLWAVFRNDASIIKFQNKNYVLCGLPINKKALSDIQKALNVENQNKTIKIVAINEKKEIDSLPNIYQIQKDGKLDVKETYKNEFQNTKFEVLWINVKDHSMLQKADFNKIKDFVRSDTKDCVFHCMAGKGRSAQALLAHLADTATTPVDTDVQINKKVEKSSWYENVNEEHKELKEKICKIASQIKSQRNKTTLFSFKRGQPDKLNAVMQVLEPKFEVPEITIKGSTIPSCFGLKSNF